MGSKYLCILVCFLAAVPFITWMSNAGTTQQIPVAINATQSGEPIAGLW